jgi:putative SOS response-associated peptidase YedK
VIERYSLTASSEQITKRFGIEVTDTYRPRYNAAPAQLLPVILLDSKGLSSFYWGEVPQWVKNKSISEKWINVRTEQIDEKPVLQKALRKNRCLIPADGFYGWKKLGKKTEIPYRFTLKSIELFSIPGFWEEYDNENGEVFHTFTLITQEATDPYKSVIERIPVIFDLRKENIWMSATSSQEELQSLLGKDESLILDYYSVDPRINKPDTDDKSLIIPTPPADQYGNLTLFD